MNKWYLLYCSRHDTDRIIRRTQSLGVDVFCPRYIKMTKRKDCHSVRKEEKVLFPNYLFLFLDIKKVHTSVISAIPGVHGFVRFGAEPCVVSENIISGIKSAVFIALDEDLNAVEFHNISEEILEEIQNIIRMNSAEARQIAFSKLIQNTLP